jgi:hypothetical protein
LPDSLNSPTFIQKERLTLKKKHKNRKKFFKQVNSELLSASLVKSGQLRCKVGLSGAEGPRQQQQRVRTLSFPHYVYSLTLHGHVF